MSDFRIFQGAASLNGSLKADEAGSVSAASSMSRHGESVSFMSDAPSAPVSDLLCELPALSTDDVLPEIRDLDDVALKDLSLDAVMMLIGAKGNSEAVKCAEGQLQDTIDRRREHSEEQIRKLDEQITAINKEKSASLASRIFRWIGSLFGAIASAVTTAVGVITANPLLVTAGICGLTAAADSIVSLATNDRVSLFGAIGKGLEAIGVPAAVSRVLSTALQAATVIVSLVSGSAGMTAPVRVLDVASKAVTVASEAGTLSSDIASSVFDYKGETARSDLKEIEAVLHRLDAKQAADAQLLETLMNCKERCADAARALADACADALKSVVAGPAAAATTV